MADEHVVGEVATCPSCGREVLQKQMIPVLADGGPPGHAYLCVDCARARIDTSQVSEPPPAPEMTAASAASDEPGEATEA